MKLYYAAGACSLSPHIALAEAGLSYEAIAVSLADHTLADGTDYYTINPFGYVPMLQLDDGTMLREGPAIVQYIADQAPDKQLAPANGTLARYQLQSWLNFISTEIHTTFSLLFRPNPAEVQQGARDKLRKLFGWLDSELAQRDYLMGNSFTVADGYLFVTSNWSVPTQVDLSGLPHLHAWRDRVAARPGVQQAMQEEGLI